LNKAIRDFKMELETIKKRAKEDNPGDRKRIEEIRIHR